MASDYPFSNSSLACAIVWASYGQDGSGYGICARLLNSAGGFDGPEFPVNNYTLNDQVDPSAATLTGGALAVVWASFGPDGSGYGIRGALFNATSATLIRAEFPVNTYTLGDQIKPNVIALSDGGFIVTWQSNGQDGSGYGIYGQRFDALGTPIGPVESMPSTRSAPSPTPSLSAPSSMLAPSSGAPSLLSTPSPSLRGSTRTPQSISSSSGAATNQSPAANSSSAALGSLLETFIYGESYPLTMDGQSIGTFVLTGGEGSFNGGNANTLTLHLDASFAGSYTGTIDLFTSAAEGAFTSLTLEGVSCMGVTEATTTNASGQVVYQLIFSGTTCTDNARSLSAF